MLSKSLMKKTVKDNFKLWAVMTGVLIGFLLICFGVMNAVTNGGFGPGGADGPGGGMGGMGGSGGGLMTGGILTQFYSMFAPILSMIYVFMTANKLIAAQVDKGSLSYVMANPIKRNQVSITQAVYLIGSVVAMFTMITATGLIMTSAIGFEIEIGSFILLNLGAMLLLLATSGISFLASCVFNLSSKSLAIGAGVPIAFFLFSTISGLGEMGIEALKYLKYLTINTLFNMSDILSNSTNMIWQFAILFGIMALCYAGGVLVFKKKDLPL